MAVLVVHFQTFPAALPPLKNPTVDFKFPLLQFEFGDFALQLLDIGRIAACASGYDNFMAQAPEHKAVEVGHLASFVMPRHGRD